MESGIYKITSPTKKVYIGSSINISNRIKYYKSLNCIGQVKLYNSLKKHGWSKHKFEILEFCNESELYLKERYYGEIFDVLSNNGLNLMLPKVGDYKVGVSDETRKKMSESKKGKLNTFYGKKHSDKSREKIRLSKIGRKPWNKGMKSKTNSYKSKYVLDLETGIFYDSCKECCEFNPYYNYSTLRSKLNGRYVNNTKFIYPKI
jgi:group I intron endonuclease